MAKGRRSSRGGLLDNFMFGVFGVNECKSDDQDWYCQLSRIFSAILMILVIFIIIYYIFNFLKNNFSFKKLTFFQILKKK